MKSRILFIVEILSLFAFSCNYGSKDKDKIISTNCIKIEITGKIDNSLQIDSIYSHFKAIPLETKKECLISEIIKIRNYKGKLFMQDKRNGLFVFNVNGKFLYEIGKKGKGPGEYLELRDFDVDKDGNIYILDFRKIQKYDNDGNYLRGFVFDFLSNTSNIRCNPLEFAINENGSFYIWGGSSSLRNNPVGNFHQIYEMTVKGKIINKYFPLIHTETQGFQNHRFIPYENLILINPFFGSNTIYSIDKDGIVNERWLIDFGRRTMKIPIPENFISLSNFKAEIDGLYYNSIDGFNETKEWIVFRFNFKRIFYNVYYSKILRKSFVSKLQTPVEHRIAPRLILEGYNDDFIALLDPEFVTKSINSCIENNLKGLSASEKDIVEQLKLIKTTENPILFVCSLKHY